MGNYIINHDIDGFEKVDIDDSRLKDKDNTIILVLNESTNDKLQLYYNNIIDIILSGAKLIAIETNKESKIRKIIFMLMVLYKNYNIYRVSDTSIIDADYIDSIKDRTPDIMEVQQYVGGDISAYSDLSMIIFGISQLVSKGNMEGLKSFIEQHMESIENSIDVIEYLKGIADSNNSGEFNKIVNSLKEKIEQSSKEMTTLNETIKQFKGDNEKLTDKLNTKDKELQSVNRKISDLEEQLKNSANGAVISTYNEIMTSFINCKTQHIIYFKELSYVRYTNSMILNLFNYLTNVTKSKIKLLIYDNRVGIPGIYKGISILNSTEYLSNKNKIIRDTAKFVVSEPNPIFLTDVLTNIDPRFDIVIVYDRMRQPTNLVSGANVARIIISNSKSTYENCKDSIKMNMNSLIISGDDTIPDAMQIGEIENYNSITESAKMTRYSKLPIKEGASERLFQTIFNKARISIGAI